MSRACRGSAARRVLRSADRGRAGTSRSRPPSRTPPKYLSVSARMKLSTVTGTALSAGADAVCAEASWISVAASARMRAWSYWVLRCELPPIHSKPSRCPAASRSCRTVASQGRRGGRTLSLTSLFRDAFPLIGFSGRKNRFPIVLHAHDRPAFRFRFVPCLVELADVRLAVVGPFALGVGVMNDTGRSADPLRRRSIAASADRRRSCRTRRSAAGRCAAGCRPACPPCRR